jgi:hypothetical protein
MRGYKTLIREAELMAMPPQAVAEVLKLRAGQSKDEARYDELDGDLEKALRGRSDPLIDLSLARYGRYKEVVSELFKSADASNPIRLACLTNRSLGREIFPSFPVLLLGSDSKPMGSVPMAEWLITASDDELCALFENPTLDDSFIRDVLERGKGWEAFPDEKLWRIVSVLCRNPRMHTPRDEDYMDGYGEYIYNAVFSAAWKLAQTAPVNELWAYALGILYEQLHTDAFSIEEPLKLAERWQIDPSDTEANEQQTKRHELGYLSDMERVRKGLARLALSKSSKLLTDLLASDDLALRASAYAAGNLNADQLRVGYEKDGEIAFTEAIHNLALWRSKDTRQALSAIAWGVVKNDKHSDLLAANQYKWKEKDMRKKHPAWFADEEDGPLGNDEIDNHSPATKADIASLSGQLSRQAQGFESAVQTLRNLLSRTGWIWWFSLGALVASLSSK